MQDENEVRISLATIKGILDEVLALLKSSPWEQERLTRLVSDRVKVAGYLEEVQAHSVGMRGIFNPVLRMYMWARADNPMSMKAPEVLTDIELLSLRNFGKTKLIKWRKCWPSPGATPGAYTTTVTVQR